jgi:hypothetical protein
LVLILFCKGGTTMNNQTWLLYLGWSLAAGVAAFSISLRFSGWQRLSRRRYGIPYIGLSGLFLYAFAVWSEVDLNRLFLNNWYWGLAAALLLGAWMVKNILSQPASTRTTGFTLLFDLLWLGMAYGLMDALLLSVLPVLATWQAFALLGWTSIWLGKIIVGLLAVAASIAVTVAYHLGYTEYRGGKVFGPVIGNTTMTLGCLLTGNPLASILSHIIMRIAGVLRGPASVIQFPPHY